MFKAGEEKQVVQFLKEKLFASSTEAVIKLSIIDPFFFSRTRFAFTKATILEILGAAPDTLSQLEIITSSKSFDSRSLADLKAVLPNVLITTVKHDGFHDRFWIINDRKGFIVGTSVNSFGKKHFFIQDDFLSELDIRRIHSFYAGTEIAQV